jgi:hypothetical protein
VRLARSLFSSRRHIEALLLLPDDGLQSRPKHLGFTEPGVPHVEDDLVEQSQVGTRGLQSAEQRQECTFQIELREMDIWSHS